MDSIKLGQGVSLGEISCSSTGCLSCRGKQSTSSLLLLLSSSGRCADCFGRVIFVVRLGGARVGLYVMAGRENEYPCCSWVYCCNTGCVAWREKHLSSSSSDGS